MDVHKLRVIRDVMTKNKRQFRIPVYQRNYDWKFENCEKLFRDIVECSQENKIHFIGTIVYLNYCNSSALDDCLIIEKQSCKNLSLTGPGLPTIPPNAIYGIGLPSSSLHSRACFKYS